MASHFSMPVAVANRLDRIGKLLQSDSRAETVRRIAITAEILLEHQRDQGDIILCRKGRPDKVVWFV